MLIDRISDRTGQAVSLRSFDRRYKFSIPGQLVRIDRKQNRITIELRPSIWSKMKLVGGGQYFVQIEQDKQLWFSARAVGVYQVPKPHLILEVNSPAPAESQVSKTPAVITLRDAANQAALRMSEINLSGATLTTTSDIGKINDQLRIQLKSPVNDEQLDLNCSIRYLHRSDSGIKYGVEFNNLNNDAIDLINRLPGSPPDCA